MAPFQWSNVVLDAKSLHQVFYHLLRVLKFQDDTHSTIGSRNSATLNPTTLTLIYYIVYDNRTPSESCSFLSSISNARYRQELQNPYFPLTRRKSASGRQGPHTACVQV